MSGLKTSTSRMLIYADLHMKRYFCPIAAKIKIHRQILFKMPTKEFHE